MYSRVLTASLFGLSAEKTWAEVYCEHGLPNFSVVGLANQPVKEAKERIKSAINNSGYKYPASRITVNLTPANRKKDGSHYDLPIALALLMAADLAKTKEYDEALSSGKLACFGELTLDGKVCPIDGALPMIIGLKEAGVNNIIIPSGNLSEAKLVEGMLFYPVESFSQAVDFVTGFERINPVEGTGIADAECASVVPDFADIRAQEMVKRASVVAAAGMHGMLMIGPPGVGKSMVGKRIAGILPPLTYKEMLDSTRIYSVAGLLNAKNSMITQRPFRSPHHSISPTSLVGGGNNPRPGEISLAHNGVLFLDELPEFASRTLEMLRQPMEDGAVSIIRVNGKITYPSRFMLVAAMNPCRCGYYGDPVKQCSCSESDRARYVGRISGPLLDRIDIHVPMERVVYGDISGESKSPVVGTSELRRQVCIANEMQAERYKNLEIDYNSQLSPRLIGKYCALDDACKKLMESAFAKWNMSARSYHRILRVARTVADLDGCIDIGEEHVFEALSYRMPDKYFK